MEKAGYIVAQLGARMHYAVPRILNDAGKLNMLHTDICAVKGWPALTRKVIPRSLLPNGLQRLIGRVPTGVPASKIKAYTSFGWEYFRRRSVAKGPAEATAVNLWAGKTFNSLVIKHIGNAKGVYTFNSAGLELIQEARRRGLYTIVEQTIAPQTFEREILDPEFQKFQELKSAIEPKYSWQKFAEREAAEWDSAHLILCGSQFVVDCIRKVGGPAEKAVVVPYGIDTAKFTPPVRTQRKMRTLNVLFVGQVGIRKGAHYLIEAARQLEKKYSEIHFRLVGAITLPASELQSLPENVSLVGPVPRTDMWKHFAWADLFCLPSLCEGSATVTYEALAMGLPVICTHNTGSVVTDGVDGYIISSCNAHEIAERLVGLASNTDLLQRISENALRKASNYSIEHYSERLLEVIDQGESLS